MKRIQIPETLTETLHWIKECTEKTWSEPPSETNDYEEWLYGAKWQPLSEAEIDSVEAKYSIKFSAEHREFLRILHTINKYEPQEYQDKNGETQKYYRPYFYNWLKDDYSLKSYFDWPFEGIMYSIEHGTWVRAWGEKPQTIEERKLFFVNWYARTPKILPLHVHRYLVADDTLLDKPVLSIYGLDIIVYNWDFKLYLLEEYAVYLKLFRKNYAYRTAFQKLRNEEIAKRSQRKIPYWEEIIDNCFMTS